jgi:hypothetical protein
VQKPLPGTPTIGVWNYRLVNFYYCAFRLGGVQRGHKNVYWFGLNVPTSSGWLLVLLALWSIAGVTNSQERDELPSL